MAMAPASREEGKRASASSRPTFLDDPQMRTLAIAVLVGVPILLATSFEGAPDDPACPEVAGWYVGLIGAWVVAVIALAVVTLVRARPSV